MEITMVPENAMVNILSILVRIDFSIHDAQVLYVIYICIYIYNYAYHDSTDSAGYLCHSNSMVEIS